MQVSSIVTESPSTVLEVLQHTLFFYKRFLLFESLIMRLERLEDDEESKAASSRFLLTRHRYISLKTV